MDTEGGVCAAAAMRYVYGVTFSNNIHLTESVVKARRNGLKTDDFKPLDHVQKWIGSARNSPWIIAITTPKCYSLDYRAAKNRYEELTARCLCSLSRYNG